MIKNTYLLFLLLLFGITGVMAQTVQIDNVVKAPGDITVKVDMLGFTGSNGSLQSIQLSIAFDEDLLYFKGISGINTNFPGWIVPLNGSASPVILQWTGMVGQDIDTKIFELDFGYSGGFNDAIGFDLSGCEIVGGGIFFPMTNVTYVAGSVTQTAATATVDLGPNQQASSTSQVLVPVNMQGSGLTAVNAFTLKIGYDPLQLTFVQTANSVLGGMFAASASDGVVTITWNGSKNIAALPDPNVFDLKFTYNGGGNAPILFKPGSQIVDASLALIPTAYTNGMIVPEPGTSTLMMDNVAGTLDTVNNTIVLVPIRLNFTGLPPAYVGGVNFKIGYDNSAVIYKGIAPGTITSGITASASNGVITIVWNNMNNTLNLNGVLMSLKFTCVAVGTSPLTFDAGTVVTQTNLSNVILTYTNGSLSVCDAVINSQPTDIAADMMASLNPAFSVGVTNPCSFQWQVKTTAIGAVWTNLANDATYSGVATSALNIANIPYSFNGYQYRCFLGTIYSNSVTLSVNPLRVNIKVILQGPYEIGTSLMNADLRGKSYFPKNQPYTIAPWLYLGSESVLTVPADVVDWVLVELRTGTAAATTVEKKAGFVLRNGNVVGTDGINPITFPGLSIGDYYIVVRHRNHLAIMSAITQHLTSSSTLYDFTTAVNKAYGASPMILSSDGKAVMIAGDVNADRQARANGSALLNDRLLTYNFCGSSTFYAYIPYDVNLDGMARANGFATLNDATIISTFLGGTTYTSKVPN